MARYVDEIIKKSCLQVLHTTPNKSLWSRYFFCFVIFLELYIFEGRYESVRGHHTTSLDHACNGGTNI